MRIISAIYLFTNSFSKSLCGVSYAWGRGHKAGQRTQPWFHPVCTPQSQNNSSTTVSTSATEKCTLSCNIVNYVPKEEAQDDLSEEMSLSRKFESLAKPPCFSVITVSASYFIYRYFTSFTSWLHSDYLKPCLRCHVQVLSLSQQQPRLLWILRQWHDFLERIEFL